MTEHASLYGGCIDASLLSENTSYAKVLGKVPPSTSVLDVGCANGRLARLLKDKGCRVVGVEPDAALAAEAREVCDVVINAGFLEAAVAGLIIERFDVILMSDVLEHMPEPSEALKCARGLAARGGLLVVSVPNIANWQIRCSLACGRFRYSPDGGLLDWGHIRFFDLESARRMLVEAGYQILEFDTVWSFPGTDLVGRIPLVRRLLRVIPSLAARVLPNLFGYQFIFVARLPSEETWLSQ